MRTPWWKGLLESPTDPNREMRDAIISAIPTAVSAKVAREGSLPTIGSVHVSDVVSCYAGLHTVGELWILATVMHVDGRVEDLACVSLWVEARGGASYYRHFKKRDEPIFLRLDAISGSLIYSMSDDGEIASCLIPAPFRSLYT